MSRLADMLMGMDRRVLPPEGIGGIPQLTAPGEGASRRWRRAAVLVIVVGMLAFPAAAIMMRPRPVTLTATGASARTVAPLPTPGAAGGPGARSSGGGRAPGEGAGAEADRRGDMEQSGRGPGAPGRHGPRRR